MNERKSKIQEKVNELFKEASSQQQFLDLSRDNDISRTGLVYEDMKFRFLRLDVD